MKDPNFSSALAPMLYAFWERRNMEGYKNANMYYYLREFDRLVKEQFNTSVVTKVAVDAWDKQKPYLGTTP